MTVFTPSYLSKNPDTKENLNVRNSFDNNPAEHFLHLHQFASADLASRSGSQITRSIKEEFSKELIEYLDHDTMSDLRYQIILNVLYYKVLDRSVFPEHLLKYVNNKEHFIVGNQSGSNLCPSEFKEGYLEDLSWVKQYIGDLVEYFISITLDEKIKLSSSNKENELLRKAFNSENTIEDFQEILKESKVSNPGSLLFKLLNFDNEFNLSGSYSPKLAS